MEVTKEMIEAGCIAAYGEGFVNWPPRAKDDGVSMVSKVLTAALAVAPGVEETAAPSIHVEPLAPLETELLTALKRFRDTIIGEVHDKWDEGMRAGKLIVALANPTLPYRRDITEIHAVIAKAEARVAPTATEGK